MLLDTIIIGAGISGLLAATQLQNSGQTVVVLDKGRQVGGRMSTRRLLADNSARADHGAQFFTVREPDFQVWVDGWIKNGSAAEWCRGFSGRDGYPRYRGMQGMTSMAKQMAQTLPIHTKTKVTAIDHQNDHWQVSTESGDSYVGKQLLLTPPVPQSLALLNTGNATLADAEKDALEAIQYDPCFAVMLVLNHPSSIPSPGGVQVRGTTIDWIGDNQQKGISSKPTVTIHGSAAFTRRYLDHDRDQVGELLISAAHTAGYLDKNHVESVHVHRWMYAQPIVCFPDRFMKTMINGSPIVFAGDGFKHARVEGAALSGLAAAQSLLLT